MSERYSRPCTPPGAPPGPRKASVRGPSASASTSSSSSKPKSYDDTYDKYDKEYKTSYQPKPYSDDKYKGNDVRKINDKVPNKLISKNDIYGDIYKSRDVSYSSERYGEKSLYTQRYSEKGRYPEKCRIETSSQQYSSKCRSSKFTNDYDSYPEKTSRYPKHESDAYYGGSGSSYDNYNSYDSYGGDRHRAGGYGAEKSLGAGSYSGDKYGGRGSLTSYGTDKLGIGYGGDKHSRGDSSYGGDKHRGGGSYASDKAAGGSSLSYDHKIGGGTRSRLYPEEDRQLYRDYSPIRTLRSPLSGGVGGSYDGYDRYSPPPRSPDRQYLDRYVIGDSVVYGPPGQYPRNLGQVSPHGRPPTPPSPQPVSSREYSRYSTTSPRRYWSGGRRSPPLPSTGQSRYRSLSPLPSTTPPRRPPSPPARRPPSPHSPYLSTHCRSRERSYDRSKDRYESKGRISSTARSPVRESRPLSDRRGSERSRAGERERRKEPERRVSSRERTHDSDSVKRGRAVERNSDCRSSSDVRSWTKDNNHSGSSQNQEKDRGRSDRRSRTPPSRSARQELSKDRRRESSRERDRSRRIEDRLGPSPASTRRSPVLRARVSRRATSPRDKKRSRRPDDLRLWIESRKSEGSKRPLSPSRSRLLAKRPARSSERSSVVKRSRLGDPKKRLGGGKARRRPLPIKKNRILKKYRRLTAKRGPRSAPGGSKTTNRSNKDSSSNRADGENNDEGDEGETGNSKPGSTATIRRVIKKPKNVSHVNRLALKPRVIRKPAQKLLRDPKEADKEKDPPASQSNKDGGSPPKEEKPTSSASESNRRPSRTF
ncbi:serine/arginine repetitive matrix protein 2 isoform X1 [Penaeus vannamei]|uniref:serine/arginine repetitive matrix protein 2 isoform X1 n=1 Tax=Penaeus vannamei TaxID=6689 RepID=UPI00387FA185